MRLPLSLLFLGLAFVLRGQDTIPPPPPPLPPPTQPKEQLFGTMVSKQPVLLHPACDTFAQQQEQQACSTAQFIAFIAEHLNYPAEAKTNGISGTVVVSYYLDVSGQIEEETIKLARDIGGGCGEEGLRIIQLMYEQNWLWIPAQQAGQPIRVLYNVPIKFRL